MKALNLATIAILIFAVFVDVGRQSANYKLVIEPKRGLNSRIKSANKKLMIF